jgi:2-C-methyl-D-erythritol 4-phosphate cytidylyltransferase
VGTTDAADEPRTPMGIVPTDGRGSMPFALLRNEPLVAIASAALERAGVELLDFDASWASVQEAGGPLVLHDPLCPLTPVGFLTETVAAAAKGDAVVVGVRPVTDTLKSVEAGVVGETVDREGVWAVCSPVVLPASVVATLDDTPDLDDLAALVAELRTRFPVTVVEAPPLARRVDDESALALLDAFAELHPE